MGIKVFAFVLAALIGAAHTLPAGYNPDDVEFVPNERPQVSGFGHTFGRPSSVDYFPFDLGFGGFNDRLQDLINRIRESVANAFAGATQNIDWSKANTTSESEIIDGNRITVNRTVYDDNGVIVVIKNVEVEPVESAESTTATVTATATPTPTPTPSIQTYPSTNAATVSTEAATGDDDIETFVDNERLSSYDNLETFDEVDFDHRHRYQVDDVEEFAGNDIESIEYHLQPEQKPYDFSRDTYVNDLLAQRGAAHNPDAELFDVETLRDRNPGSGNRLRNRNA